MDVRYDITVAHTEVGLNVLAEKLKVAGFLITRDALHEIQKLAITMAPMGSGGNSTNPPGTLKRHITVEGPRGRSVRWEGVVGPTVTSANRWMHNYGGQREFGGPIYAGQVARSLLSSGGRAGEGGAPRLFFRIYSQWYSPVMVNQKGAHYLLRARIFAMPGINRAIRKRLSEAIVV